MSEKIIFSSEFKKYLKRFNNLETEEEVENLLEEIKDIKKEEFNDYEKASLYYYEGTLNNSLNNSKEAEIGFDKADKILKKYPEDDFYKHLKNQNLINRVNNWTVISSLYAVLKIEEGIFYEISTSGELYTGYKINLIYIISLKKIQEEWKTDVLKDYIESQIETSLNYILCILNFINSEISFYKELIKDIKILADMLGVEKVKEQQELLSLWGFDIESNPFSEKRIVDFFINDELKYEDERIEALKERIIYISNKIINKDVNDLDFEISFYILQSYLLKNFNIVTNKLGLKGGNYKIINKINSQDDSILEFKNLYNTFINEKEKKIISNINSSRKKRNEMEHKLEFPTIKREEVIELLLVLKCSFILSLNIQ